MEKRELAEEKPRARFFHILDEREEDFNVGVWERDTPTKGSFASATDQNGTGIEDLCAVALTIPNDGGSNF